MSNSLLAASGSGEASVNGISTLGASALVKVRTDDEGDTQCLVVRKQYVERAKRLLAARGKINKLMPRKLFRDSAWDVMLELYIGAVSGQGVYVKQVIIASGECAATAMRIIARLDASKFLIRSGDPLDQRRVVVSLTEKGRNAMELLLQQMEGTPLHVGRGPTRFAMSASSMLSKCAHR